MRRALSMLLAIVAMLVPAASAIAAPMRDAARVELGAENRVKAISPSGVVEAEGHTLFLQRDPNGYQDSVNQYAYGANDPINHRDPTGQCLEDGCVLEALGFLASAETALDIASAASSTELCLSQGIGYECAAAVVSMLDALTGPNPMGDIAQGGSVAMGNKRGQASRIFNGGHPTQLEIPEVARTPATAKPVYIDPPGQMSLPLKYSPEQQGEFNFTPKGPMVGTYGELRYAGAKDAHHIIQDAAVRDLPGYSRSRAPAIELPGPSTRVGSPHYAATQVQREPGGGNYAAERRIGYKSLRRAGLSPDEARARIEWADQYFKSIGVQPSTPTKVPGNR